MLAETTAVSQLVPLLRLVTALNNHAPDFILSLIRRARAIILIEIDKAALASEKHGEAAREWHPWRWQRSRLMRDDAQE